MHKKISIATKMFDYADNHQFEIMEMVLLDHHKHIDMSRPTVIYMIYVMYYANMRRYDIYLLKYTQLELWVDLTMDNDPMHV